MADTRPAAIHIGQMNLRLPGGNADDGRRVAEGVSQRLADRLPHGVERRLGALSVRIEQPVSAAQDEMSAAIANAIMNALERGQHA